MQIEHLVKMLTVDEAKDELEKLAAAGWEIIPNVPPVVIYHLARLKPDSLADLGIKAELKIDESKVLTLRGGKFYNAAGVETDEAGTPIGEKLN